MSNDRPTGFIGLKPGDHSYESLLGYENSRADFEPKTELLNSGKCHLWSNMSPNIRVQYFPFDRNQSLLTVKKLITLK